MGGAEPPTEILRFGAAAALVLTGFSAATGRGWAVQLEAPADAAAIEAAMQEILAKLAGPPSTVEWKAVGAGPLLRLTADKLRQRGAALKAAVLREASAGEAIFYMSSGRLRISRTGSSAPDLPAPAATKMRSGPIRVLIVDDSITIRRLLLHILGKADGIEVVADTGVPSQVAELIERHRPDVLTLDIHMPQMDGVTLLRELMPRFRLPTIMISSLALEEGPLVLAALAAGAVDYIQKPSQGTLAAAGADIVARIKMAAAARVSAPRAASAQPRLRSNAQVDSGRLIAIGSSTGGTQALQEVLTNLPAHIPPIVIVQHIPPLFSKALAKRLDDLCPFSVKEAEDGDSVEADRVLIAPGGKQMRLINDSRGLSVVVEDAALRNLHKPSVDVLFESVARTLGAQAVGVILTGMGADGALGLLEMAKAGARTIGQNEASCIVYGMPRRAAELGAVQEVLDLTQIAQALLQGRPARSRR